MLCGISHDWQQNQADKCLSNARLLDNAVDRVNQILCTERNGQSDHRQHDYGLPGLQNRNVVVLAVVGAVWRLLEELGMSLELEQQIQQVDDQQNKRSAPRQRQNRIVAVLNERGGVERSRNQQRRGCNRQEDDMVWAAVWLNDCWTRLKPSATKQHPSCSSRLDRMDPSIDAWTILIWPCRRATMATISSTALPNVALSSPPKVWPTRSPVLQSRIRAAPPMAQWPRNLLQIRGWLQARQIRPTDPPAQTLVGCLRTSRTGSSWSFRPRWNAS